MDSRCRRVFPDFADRDQMLHYINSALARDNSALPNHAPSDMSGQKSILFVDDDARIATFGQQALSACGYQVETRTSSIDALNLFRADPDAWDLVITDQSMPQMTGLELAREMLVMRVDLPILLCSGFGGQDSRASAEAAGLYGFLAKPFSNQDLVATVRSALDAAKSG